MMQYYSSHNVHSKRLELVYSKYTFDNLDFIPIRGKECIGHFEHLYGIPTDIDKVWADREAQYEKESGNRTSS